MTLPRPFIPFVLIILVGILAYSNSFQASFQFDDGRTIVNNPAIRDVKNLKQLWNLDPSRFITHLSFAVNYFFGKLDVRGYHLVNFGIHLLNSIIVFFLSRFIFIRSYPQKNIFNADATIPAAFTSLIFLSHPIQTAAVTYIVQRATLLAALCYISSIALYVLFRQKNNKFFYGLSFVAASFGLFCKPIIITLPLAIFLFEYCFF